MKAPMSAPALLKGCIALAGVLCMPVAAIWLGDVTEASFEPGGSPADRISGIIVVALAYAAWFAVLWWANKADKAARKQWRDERERVENLEREMALRARGVYRRN